MVQLRNVLRTIAIEEHEPSALLDRANHVTVTLHGGDTPLTTCCVATFDPETRRLRWSTAGHPPPLVRSHDGSARYLEVPSGPPLGVIPDPRYETSSATLAPGDRLVLYTDGLIERRDASLDFGMDMLKNALTEVARLAPGAAAEWLAQRISPGIDDVAIIVVDLVDG
jgi:serine phosphatase RsbU (regulator of sigma subunit)